MHSSCIFLWVFLGVGIYYQMSLAWFYETVIHDFDCIALKGFLAKLGEFRAILIIITIFLVQLFCSA